MKLHNSKLICAIMQPTYLPWSGYFDLIDSVDKFVFLDNVNLVKRGWHVRNRIKSVTGEVMLSLSVKTPKGTFGTMINETILEPDFLWAKKHLNTIFHCYKKSSYFDEVYPFFERILSNDFKILSDLTIHIITEICEILKIETQLIKASDLSDVYGDKDHRLVSICNSIGANQYLSPQGSAVYLEENSPGGEIVKNNIELFYHNFEHPIYNQLYGNFISHLSVVDLFFNLGFIGTITAIREGRGPKFECMDFRKNMGI